MHVSLYLNNVYPSDLRLETTQDHSFEVFVLVLVLSKTPNDNHLFFFSLYHLVVNKDYPCIFSGRTSS